jgi:hypothetical protein
MRPWQLSGQQFMRSDCRCHLCEVCVLCIENLVAHVVTAVCQGVSFEAVMHLGSAMPAFVIVNGRCFLCVAFV